MEASGQRGIPTAFIIDANGTVAWIGHPMRMDEPLEQIVNGTWDLAAATAQFEKEHAQDRAMMEMRTTYAQAMQNEDWDMWIAAIDNFTDTYGSNDQMNSMKFDALLNGKQDAEAAYAWARVMLEASWDDPQTLNAYAWKMLDETPDELKDLDFALEIATRASALTNNEDAAILDTLARAYWELGDTDQAIAWQEKAVSFAEEPLVDDLAATLARYQNYDPIAEEMVAVAAEPTPEHTPEGTPELASEPEPAPEPELQPLAVGDTAPEISIDHWVKGDPIEGFDEGKVYVMEFWATWCGPCVTSMPHLSALQDTYGDAVKIIGVSSEKELETVTNFLDQTNKKDDLLNTERMRYTVTVDPDRSTSRAYMEASGQRGIPTAFIIDANGTVAWIGHPMRMDEPLEQIVNGTWDLAAATATFAQEQAQQAAMDEMRSIYNTAMENEDWDMWIAAIDNFTDTYGSNDQMNSMKFDALLNGKQDAEAAYAWARVMLADSWDDPFALNAFAWNILDETPSELQNLEYALEVAIRACELTNNEDPMILDTLARAYWELGETYKAIAWQQKAVAFAEEGEMGDEIASTLKRYELSLASVTEE
jgi:thiol-disulfide isomerase/thioredoxin